MSRIAEKQAEAGDFESYLKRLEIDGLRGRLWRAPSLTEKNGKHLIIVVYGHHASLERSAGLAQYLRRFGRVAMPDLPGLGGMESFYKASKRPTLDNYAHFLEKFIAGHCGDERSFSLIGFSFGFLVATRWLQLYPGRRENLRLILSVTGFLNGRSLGFSPLRRFWSVLVLLLLKTRAGSFCFRHLLLNGWVLRRFYSRVLSARGRFAHFSPERRRQLMEVEVGLWRINDVRSWAFTASEMLTCDLTSPAVDSSLLHVFASGDHFLDNERNNEQLALVYNEVKLFEIDLANHAPTVVATPEEVEELIPKGMAAALEKEAFMKKKLRRQ